MDLQDWEFVSGDGLLQINDDGGKTNGSVSNEFADSKDESLLSPEQLIPLSIQLNDPTIDHPDVVVNKITTNIPDEIPETAAPVVETGKQDQISQVLFKKTEEIEFADMIIDSPDFVNKGFFPQIEEGVFQFEEKTDEEKAIEGMISEGKTEKKEMEIEWGESNEDGMNLWKGVGAICSFGMAAATICIIIFGNAQRNKHNHKLGYQIYSSKDKRIKQVVEQATKLNEAISSAVRGVPLTRAHITSGGYYDAL